MQLLSIGVEERDMSGKEALFRKAQIRKPDGLDIEEKKAGDLLFLNYTSRQDYDSGTIKSVQDKLHQYVADTVSEIILEDLQSEMVEKIIRDEYFYFEQEERNKILRDAFRSDPKQMAQPGMETYHGASGRQ